MSSNEVMRTILIVVRDTARSKQSNIRVSHDATVQEILDGAVTNWALSTDYEYVIRAERLGQQLGLTRRIGDLALQDRDVLEIQALSEAGSAQRAS